MYLEECPAARPTVAGTSVRVYNHPFRSWPVVTPAPHLRPSPAAMPVAVSPVVVMTKRDPTKLPNPD